ncbi:hypothetical protein SAMN02910317_01672 [Ruminococcaceae bacterium FB2012]|nr:hypothetical protein SAMN02910317_01672 [Ruminococcaceae bacterium FB2012]
MTHFLRISASPNTGVSLCWDFSPPFGAGQYAPPISASGDGKTLVRVAPSLFPASAGGHFFRRCVWFVHAKKSGITAFEPYLFQVQRRSRRLRAERGSASSSAGALPPSPRGLCPSTPPGLPRPGLRNAASRLGLQPYALNVTANVIFPSSA